MSVSIDQVREEIARQLRPDSDDAFAWVREMFTDRAILEIEQPGQQIQLVEVAWSIPDDTDDLADLELGDPAEVTLEYVAKAEGGPRLAGPIVRKDAAKQIAYSAVLVPGEPDADGEELTAVKVEDVAHTWLEQFRAFDVEHSVKQVDVAPVESYIEPADRTVQIDGEDVVLPAGTWTVAVKARDADVWAEMADGTRTGLSVMGVPNDQLDAALAAVKSGESPALKRVTLADVGGGDANGDWFAPFIGIVDQPAVPKAKFYAFKSVPKQPGLARRLADALTGTAPKAGRRVSDSRYAKALEAYQLLGEIIAEAEEERDTTGAGKSAHDPKEGVPVTPEQIEEVAGAVKSALGLTEEQTLDDKIASAVDEHLTAGDGRKGATKNDGDGDGDGSGEDAFTEAQMAQLKELIDPIAEKADRAEQRTRPGSRQPDPDHDPDPLAVKSVDRDAFGRRVDA